MFEFKSIKRLFNIAKIGFWSFSLISNLKRELQYRLDSFLKSNQAIAKRWISKFYPNLGFEVLIFLKTIFKYGP